MEEKKCTGDCLLCSAQQRLYCTTHMLLNIITTINKLEVHITSIEETLKEINCDSTLCKPEIEKP